MGPVKQTDTLDGKKLLMTYDDFDNTNGVNMMDPSKPNTRGLAGEA
ncbi:MAG: hypothetical protein MI921_01885 [Cytophagales bacterium]|nr:hypothetical protein [Cytophagales bacterium]